MEFWPQFRGRVREEGKERIWDWYEMGAGAGGGWARWVTEWGRGEAGDWGGTRRGGVSGRS